MANKRRSRICRRGASVSANGEVTPSGRRLLKGAAVVEAVQARNDDSLKGVLGPRSPFFAMPSSAGRDVCPAPGRAATGENALANTLAHELCDRTEDVHLEFARRHGENRTAGCVDSL
jgi:hypothetical protein